MENNDRHIIRRVIDGSTESYKILMDRYSQQVFSLVVKIVSREDDAEEITQDVFVNAYRNLEKFDFRSTFSTWLYRIAYNEAVSHTRRKKVETTPIDEATLNNLPDARVDSFLESDNPRLAALSEAIEALSVDERALISFHYFEGIPLKEVADMMRIGESAAKVRLMRTRKKLYVLINKLSGKYE
ncbi:MAG: RNA polymerase sigma factor [Muribaculaceae bacterium]|nr:RNA polymerase sigma factor [Muribaculaceae bacterium]